MNWETISKKLEEPLDKSKVKTREGSGNMKLSYVDGFHVIDEANRIFGFDGWQRATQTPLMVQCEQDAKQKWRVSYTCQVCVTVDGISRDGVGFGQGIDVDLGKAHESAIKEAETDAMKRAFMTFGYTFGLALYDKSQEHVELKVESGIPASVWKAVDKQCKARGVDILTFNEKVKEKGLSDAKEIAAYFNEIYPEGASA